MTEIATRRLHRIYSDFSSKSEVEDFEFFQAESLLLEFIAQSEYSSRVPMPVGGSCKMEAWLASDPSVLYISKAGTVDSERNKCAVELERNETNFATGTYLYVVKVFDVSDVETGIAASGEFIVNYSPDSDLVDYVGTTTYPVAEDIAYDNTASELVATDVQGAIDEIDARVDQLSGSITITARNETGVQIDKGSVVYISGSTGNRSTIALAVATDGNTAQKTIGVAYANIAHNADGEVVVLGELSGVDLSDFEDGDELYLSETPGGIANTPPAGDADWSYRIGYAETAQNNGKLLVAPQFRGTVYGANFFAATSASGVRTTLDVPSNSEAILASGDDQTITGATNVQLNMATSSNGAALLYLGDTNSTSTGLVSRLRLYGADGRFWNWFVQGSAGAPDGHLFQLRYNNENDIASSAIFWFDPADGITTMRMHNRGLVVHRASDDAMTFDVDEDGNVNANALTLTTDLAVTEGGTGASTASGARTNLGLGTIATQDADSVAITGGTITASSGRIASVEVNAQTGTTYTLVLGDAGKVVTMSNAAANTLTIPTNASVAYDVGTVINVMMIGAGTTTIAGDTGVTVNGTSAGSVDVSAQYQGVALLKIATDSWAVSGAIA